jgi:hypothetical protein
MMNMYNSIRKNPVEFTDITYYEMLRATHLTEGHDVDVFARGKTVYVVDFFGLETPFEKYAKEHGLSDAIKSIDDGCGKCGSPRVDVAYNNKVAYIHCDDCLSTTEVSFGCFCEDGAKR